MTSGFDRRTFLSRVSAATILGGLVPSLDELDGLPPSTGPVFTPRTQDSDARVFAAARKQLLIPTSVAFCNTGTLGSSPREVIDAVVEGYRAVERDLPAWAYRPAETTDPPPMTGYHPIPQFREEIGRLINSTLDEIAITQNATMGMSMLANGLDLAPGDEILTSDQEHVGGIKPWQLRERRHGIVVKQVTLAPALERGPDAVVQLFANAITPRTRVVMFSHITSVKGIKLPARELCALARERDVLSIVDGAQVVGQMPLDVKAIGCDAYITSTHKWLLAPKGTGLLHLRREVQDRFWNTLVTEGFDDQSLGAFRLTRFGSGSLPVVIGLRAAARFMTRLGLERIERWDTMLTTRLRDGLARMPHVTITSPADRRLWSAMTTFAVAGQPSRDVQDALWKRKVRVRAEAEHGVRFSAHFYVSPGDVDRTLEVVEALR